MRKANGTLKKLTVFKAMNAHATPRKCALHAYNAPMATHFGYGLDARGNVDKSSKTPVCEEHAR